jgi:hypothetical protein
MRLLSLCPCGHLKHGESFLLKAFASTYRSKHCSTGISSCLGLQRIIESRSIMCFECCRSFTLSPPENLGHSKRLLILITSAKYFHSNDATPFKYGGFS